MKTAKKAAKKAVKKAAAKSASKAPAKKSVKAKAAATVKKSIAKATRAGKTVAAKRELKPSTKAPANRKPEAAKAAPKATVKAATKGVKKAAKKAPAKTAAKAKTATKTATPVSATSLKKRPVIQLAPKAPRTAVKKTVAAPAPRPKSVTTPVTTPAPAPQAAGRSPESDQRVNQAMKGLKGMGGALGARIAHIVAESALRKPLAESAEDSRGEDLATDISRPVASNAGKDADPVEVAHKAAALLFAKKAEDMVLLDLRGLSTVADYYLICTCQNEPQMRAMLNDVQRTLSREGIKSLRSEYMSGVRWAIIDYGDLIIHLFESQTRGYYSLERLWADAPSTRLKAEDFALHTESDTEEDDDL